jgi:hypothetical protein
MDWIEWADWYRRIVADLELDPARDREAAAVLKELSIHCQDGLLALERAIRGKEANIFGPAPFPPENFSKALKITAGAATEQLIRIDEWPDIVVTDLDGDVQAQVEANRRGAIAVIHAHGDNVDALREWVPKFTPPVVCTTQCEPIEGIFNFGGFTDGDRAVFLAAHFGASRIILRGFDFENPVGKQRSDRARKMKKLDYARQLIDHAAMSYGIEIQGHA